MSCLNCVATNQTRGGVLQSVWQQEEALQLLRLNDRLCSSEAGAAAARCAVLRCGPRPRPRIT